MRNKLYWGIAILIVLVIAVGGFVFVHQWQEIRELEAELDKSDKPVTKDDLPPADPGFKWVPHGNHFHQVPIDAPDEWQGEPHTDHVPSEVVSVDPHVHKWAELSLEDRKQLVEVFYSERGLKPPPEGYEYRWKSADVPMLDDNGQPILHPIGEPIVEVETGIGFAPTPAQYQRYKALKTQYNQHMQSGNIAEAKQIAADIALLEKEAEGEIPIIRVILKSSGLSDEQVKEKMRQAADSVRRSAYESHNLGYLLE